MSESGLFTGTILLSALGSFGLGGFLWLRAHQAVGARPLAGFLGLVGLWSLGLLWPTPGGTALMTLAPLGAAAFVHFSLSLSERSPGPSTPAYVVAALTAVMAWVQGPGKFIPWFDQGWIFQYSGMGWAVIAVTLILAVVGHGLLFQARSGAHGKQRQQLSAVLLSSLLGLISVSGLAFPLFGIEMFPWPMLALPAYVVILAYAVLRYELMAVNRWARGAVITLGLALLAALGAGGVMAYSAQMVGNGTGFLTLWITTSLVMAGAVWLWSPLQRMANRLVFPGGDVTAADLAQWRAELDQANSQEALFKIAGEQLSQRMKITVWIGLDETRTDHSTAGLQCDQTSDGWRTHLVGWEDAPPSPQRVAEIYADLVAEALRGLDRRLALANQERQRQARERLAELGSLAAVVAHDLRNPLNILSMAVADAEPITRQEVTRQVKRMETLTRDLLDYAKPWQVKPQPLNLKDMLQECSTALPNQAIHLDVAEDARLHADPARLRQALINLLTNAHNAGGEVGVRVEQDEAQTCIHVCDNGSGIPEDIRADLFKPFVSRGQNGSGLGLAIAAKIMAAHQGHISIGNHPGWTTCFTLSFPHPGAL